MRCEEWRKSCVHLVLHSLLCLLLLFRYDVAACSIERCARNFNKSLKRDKTLVSRNVPYCFLLQRFAECLETTSRMCIGNLNYHYYRTLVKKERENLECAKLTAHLSLPNYLGGEGEESEDCHFPYKRERNERHRFCALFGDPHLRTFNGHYHTCGVSGAWPLVDNPYFAIQVTNQRMSAASNPQATAISKVIVIVKKLRGCSAEKMYEADSSRLPTSFVDGTQWSGSVERPTVQILHPSPGSKVEIRLLYISARILISKHDSFLSVAVKLPEHVMEQGASVGLCSTGCPSRERLSFRHVLQQPNCAAYSSSPGQVVSPPISPSTALLLCQESGLTDFYLDSCVFDLLVSGRVVFREVAKDALQDIRSLYSPYRRHYERNRTDLHVHQIDLQDIPPCTSPSPPVSAAPAPHTSLWTSCSLLALFLLLNSL